MTERSQNRKLVRRKRPNLDQRLDNGIGESLTMQLIVLLRLIVAAVVADDDDDAEVWLSLLSL